MRLGSEHNKLSEVDNTKVPAEILPLEDAFAQVPSTNGTDIEASLVLITEEDTQAQKFVYPSPHTVELMDSQSSFQQILHAGISTEEPEGLQEDILCSFLVTKLQILH